MGDEVHFNDPRNRGRYRIDVRPHGSGPDETEGRMIYRAIADAEARMQMALTRKVKMRIVPISDLGISAIEAERAMK